MSLHRYVVPPPLALAVHPAPVPVPKPKESEKDKDKEADKEKDKGKQQDAKEGEKDKGKGEIPKDNDGEKKGAPAPEGKAAAGEKAKEGQKEVAKVQDKDERADENAMPDADEPATPATPATPGSMTPEPPTPIPGAQQAESPEESLAVDGEGLKDKGKDSAGEEKGKGKVGDKKTVSKLEEGETKGQKPSTSIQDITPEPESEIKPAEQKVEPIRLLPPAPARPIRTRLDLNPSKPYPPVNTDPRGAYNKYAKAVGNEWILIDVTKDGWLAEQWKERTEREALKRLTGEWEKELEKEMEKQRRRAEVRQLPRTAEGIILELWNELVDANNYEISAQEFWSRYDWTTESAKIHLSDARLPQTAKGDEDKQPEKGSTGAKGSQSAEEQRESKDEEVEWTKAGFEEILAKVSVQCAYNTAKPLPRSYYESPSAYLLMSHSYFMLRNDTYLIFKPEQVANQFEVLVTSGHDRVFGAMVKAQREKDYKERKEREKKEKAAEANANVKPEDKKGDEKEGNDKKEKREGDEGNAKLKDGKKVVELKGKVGSGQKSVKADEQDKRVKNSGDDADANANANADGLAAGTPAAEPGTPASNVKLLDGEPVGGVNSSIKGRNEPTKLEDGKVELADKVKHAPDAQGAVAVVNLKSDTAMIAIPVDNAEPVSGPGLTQNLDQKHEQEAVVVPGPKTKGVEGEAGKAAGVGVGPGAGVDDKGKGADAKAAAEKPMNMDQIAQAFQALEAANAPKPVDPNSNGAGKEGKKEALVWTWGERCEMWRWKNFEAGVHEVGPGGWEERDWKVFADDREVWDYDADEALIEDEEEDVHDWSI